MREGNRVRITAQLIHAASDRHLWGESYERDLVEVLSLQRQVARAIANQVRVTLTPEEERTLLTDRAVAPAAQEAYLRGLHLFNTGLMTMDAVGLGLLEPLRQSITAFEDATGLDPSWAQAWAALARSRHWVASFGNPELYPAAKTAALRAIELDDSTSRSSRRPGLHSSTVRVGLGRRGSEFKRAIELNPNIGNSGHHGYGIMLSILGRHEEALAMFAQAEELDPLVLALQAMPRRLQSGPGAMTTPSNGAGARSRPTRRPVGHTRSSGRRLGARAEPGRPGSVPTRAGPVAGNRRHVSCGVRAGPDGTSEQRRCGSCRRSACRKTAGRPKSSWLDRARGYACLGDARTFDMLELALAMRVEALPTINVDSSFDAVRPDPRFQAILRKMNLPSALD